MDLTVLATPFYYATMLAEHRWLKAHRDDPAYDAGQFERRDTTANMTMAHLSVVAPLLNKQFRRHLELGKGRAAVPMLATAAVAATTATVADAVARRRRSRTTAELRDVATTDERDDAVARRVEQVAGAAAVAALATGGLVVTSTWAQRFAAPRLWDRRLTDLGTGLAGWATALVGWDLIYYWNHRFMHETRWLWAIHVVHHSSEHYNLSTALRQPVLDVFGMFVPYGALSLLGFRPDTIETARGVNLLYQYWIHTETIGKLGPVEEVFNTASHHRVHHGSNPRYLDKNFGGQTMIWDRVFGTYEPETETVRYGATETLLNSGVSGTILGGYPRLFGWGTADGHRAPYGQISV